MEIDTKRQIVFRIMMYACTPVIFLCAALGLLGAYIVFAQIVLWLKTGYWVSLPMLLIFVDPWPIIANDVPMEQIAVGISKFSNPFIVFGVEVVPPRGYWEWHRYFGKFSHWLIEPQSWIGVHKIIRGTLETIPISLFILFLAAIVYFPAVLCLIWSQDELKGLKKKKLDI